MNKPTSVLLALIIVVAAALLIYAYTQKDEIATPVNNNTSGRVVTPATTSDETSPMLMRIKNAVLSFAQVGTTSAKINVSSEGKEWSDSCLGLGKANESCAHVVTPGYEVKIESGTTTHTYRTNADGSVIREDK